MSSVDLCGLQDKAALQNEIAIMRAAATPHGESGGASRGFDGPSFVVQLFDTYEVSDWHRFVMDWHGLSWIAMDCHGLM